MGVLTFLGYKYDKIGRYKYVVPLVSFIIFFIHILYYWHYYGYLPNVRLQNILHVAII